MATTKVDARMAVRTVLEVAGGTHETRALPAARARPSRLDVRSLIVSVGVVTTSGQRARARVEVIVAGRPWTSEPPLKVALPEPATKLLRYDSHPGPRYCCL